MPADFLTWGFLGLFAGIWKLATVGLVVLVLFGRSPWVRHPLMRLIRLADPSPARPNHTQKQAARPGRRWGDRVYVFLLVVAATAVATWIVTRMTIATFAHSPR